MVRYQRHATTPSQHSSSSTVRGIVSTATKKRITQHKELVKKIKANNSTAVSEVIEIDSEDEETYYIFPEPQSKCITRKPKSVHNNRSGGKVSTNQTKRLTSGRTGAESSRAKLKRLVSISGSHRKDATSMLTSSDLTPQTSPTRHTRSNGHHGHSSSDVRRNSLHVQCLWQADDQGAMAPPPPSPFLAIKSSNTRSVARIPISPYAKSPSVLTAASTNHHHSHSLEVTSLLSSAPGNPSSSRRVTRSSPLKAAQLTQRLADSKSAGSPTRCRSIPGSANRQEDEHYPSRRAYTWEETTLYESKSRGAREVTPYSHTSRSAANERRIVRATSPTPSERRLSVRQTESAFKYTDILVKKTHSFTQVILNAVVGPQRNVLTVKALQELTSVLNNAKYDDTSNIILLTGSENGTFCSGLDLSYLTTGDTHLAARTLSDALREFIKAALTFPKPLVAAVNGEAIGCGVAILPLCDVVYASDKATFFTPYTQLGQVPEAGLSCSLSHIIGMALANEMLMAGRMLTALEAYQMGLVAQVFWPTSMMQEVIPRITNMATSCSTRVLNATKSLIKSQYKERLLAASHTEASMLAEIWPTPECQRLIRVFLQHCQSV